MSNNKILVGGGIVRDAAMELARRPLNATTVVVAALLTGLVAPLWGVLLPRLGWLAVRERLPSDGVISLGAVLAPRRAREQFRDGVWRGLWRVHGVSVAFAVVQAPILLLVMLPAAVAFLLCKSVGPLYPHPVASLAVSYLLPAAIGIACITIAAGESILAYRMLRSLRGPYPLGLIYRVTGAAWQVTLDHIATLASLGISLAIVGVLGGVVAGALASLADVLLQTGGQMVIALWLAVVIAVILFYVSLESVARWVDGVTPAKVDEANCFSFSDWLWDWLASVFGWFGKQGMIAVGTGACLVIGLLTGVAALATQQVFTSWVGLGWFAVTAAVLVTIRLAERKK